MHDGSRNGIAVANYWTADVELCGQLAATPFLVMPMRSEWAGGSVSSQAAMLCRSKCTSRLAAATREAVL